MHCDCGEEKEPISLKCWGEGLALSPAIATHACPLEYVSRSSHVVRCCWFCHLFCVQSNHARSLRLLFKAKAAVNSCLKKNNGGWSPLFVAAGAGHTAVVRALLRHADIRPSVIQRSLAPRTCWNQTIPAGLTPLDVARRLKRTDCVRALANTTASVSAAAAALRAVHSQQIFQNASNGRMSTPSSALTKPGKASGAEIGASRKRPRVQNST